MIPDAIFVDVHMYGVMIAIGLLCAFGVLFFYSKVLNVERDFVDLIFYISVAAIVLGFGAATLIQAFYNYLEDPDAGFKIGEGFTFLRRILFTQVRCSQDKIQIKIVADIAGPSMCHLRCPRIRQNRLFFCRMLLWNRERAVWLEISQNSK